jgi:hypothetical protein
VTVSLAVALSGAGLALSVLSVAVALARWAGRLTALVEMHDRQLAQHEAELRALRARGLE